MALFSEAGLEVAGAPVPNRVKVKYLKRYAILDREIDRLLAEAERLRARLGKLTPTLTDMPGGGGSIYKSSDLDLIDKIVDIEREVNQHIDDAILLKEHIQTLINAVEDNVERLLLNYRYIDGNSFEWIASTLHYSWRHTHRLHSKALNNIKL